MIYYVIPARKGSKGFPGKNRILFNNILSVIPEDKNIVVTTDDEIIENMADGCTILKRGEDLSNDTASVKDVLIDVIDRLKLKDNDIIVMLYCTYPQRTWKQIKDIQDYFRNKKAKSLLCKKEVKTHPYLCIYENGQQVIEHDLYRRQDYPKVYELSHFVFMSLVSEIKNLNKNLYNQDTKYYLIDNVIDIDYEVDLEFLK